MSAITHVIMHCSDSEFGDAALIRSWHLARGWADIGYHKVVLNGFITKGAFNRSRNGEIQDGRPLNEDNFISPEEVGAHTLGYNARSIGICLIGVKSFSAQQFIAATGLVYALCYKHKIPQANILGHCETESGKAEGKTCPNFDMNWFRANVRLP